VVVWLLQQIDVPALQRVAVAPAVWPLLGMVVVAWVCVLLGGMKFWVLYHALTPVAFCPFLRYFVVATSLGAFTPASLGDFSLAALLREKQIAVHTSMSVLVVDRALTVSIYAAVFVPLTLGLLFHSAYVWWIPASFLAGGTLLLVLAGNTALRQLGCRVLERLHLPFLVDFVATTSDLLWQYPWHLLGNIALTFLRCVTAGVVIQCALWAAGEWQPFLPVLYTTNTISVLNLLPISFAGLGMYEGGGVAILSHLGFDQERVLAALVYQRIYIILYSLVILLGSRTVLTGVVSTRKEPA
jgi:uncharacterized membrane protein YbhN (UPF0104 family)